MSKKSRFLRFDFQELASPTKKGRGGLGGGDEPEPDLEPLPEGTLARNLGLDLIVVVSKEMASIKIFSYNFLLEFPTPCFR